MTSRSRSSRNSSIARAMPSVSRWAPPRPGTSGWRTRSSRARRLHRRPPAALLGRRAVSRRRSTTRSRSSSACRRPIPDKPIIIAEIGWPSRGPHARVRGGLGCPTRRCSCGASWTRAEKEQIVYYVMEAFDQPWKALPGGRRRLLLGRVRREPQSEVRLHSAIVRVPEWHMLAAISVAVALLVLGVFYLQQRYAAQPRPQLPRARGVCGRHDRCVGVLRLHAAVHDRLERRCRACCCCSACWVSFSCCSPRRTSGPRRTGSTYAAAPADRRCCAADDAAAEGLHPRAGLQRAAGDADRDARCAGAARLPEFRSAGDRQQHAGRGGLAPGRGALRAPRASASASSMSRRWRASRPAP